MISPQHSRSRMAAGTGPPHLMVMQHGLHGTPSSMGHLADAFRKAHGAEMEVVVARSNSGAFGKLSAFFMTSDGVQAGARRLADEVRALLRARSWVRKLSFLGVSLGGLYVRCALGELDFGPELELVHLILVVSPSTGVRTHLNAAYSFAVGVMNVCGRTGQDLMLLDEGQARWAGVRVGAAGTVTFGDGSSFEPVEGDGPRTEWLRTAADEVGASGKAAGEAGKAAGEDDVAAGEDDVAAGEDDVAAGEDGATRRGPSS